ncbi:MAG TPA: hypothetical protein PLU35_04720 [Phycisphaerales bacterium]|nr:hypothetical protein [Phycisphaerales bacterium]
MNTRRKSSVVLSLDRDGVIAVWGEVSGGRVQVKAWVNARLPREIDGSDASAVGAWLRQTLRDAGITARAAVFAVPRANVVLKRLSLPRPSEPLPDGRGSFEDESDLAGMVALQMSRQLTMPMQGAVIDFLPIDLPDGTETTVLAGALPGDQVTWCRSVAKAAGLRVKGIHLRGEGAAALLAELSHRQDGALIGVAIAGDTVELVVIEEGRLVSSRGVDVPTGDDPAFAQRLAVEAKRTWMSYRGTRDSAEVECVAVLGSGARVEAVGAACGRELELPWSRVGLPGMVDLPEELRRAEAVLPLVPLIGLFVGQLASREWLDFANPRRAPDRAARVRQAALLGVFAVIVVGGGSYVWGLNRLAALDGRIAAEKARNEKLVERYSQHVRQKARLEHLERWSGFGVDWLAHLEWIGDQAPADGSALVDQIDASLEASVAFASRERQYTTGKWSQQQESRFRLQGRSQQRTAADELRGRLVADRVYRVDTTGPDVPNRFDFTLVTGLARPDRAANGAAGERAADGGGGG